jgi:amidase
VSTWIARIDGPPASGDRLRVAVKDLIDLAGYPTTNGSKVIAATAAPAIEDAPCLAGTRARVAVIVGKTNMHELAFGVTGINPWFGTPVNPLDPRLVPGGSSSGSAVAVATGEADVAFGSDTGGSIRIPAASCGVAGLKTTQGRIPLAGVRPLAPSLDTVGPMGATVAAVVTGMQLLEPGFAPAPLRAARLGRLRLPAATYIDAAIDSALAALGIPVVEVHLPGWDGATEATMIVLGAEAWQVHADLWRQHAGGISPDVAERLATSSTITTGQLAGARNTASRWRAELADLFDQVDVLALPTLAATPPRLEDAAQMTKIRYAAPFNLAGVPALSMPVATTRGAGPVPASLQLVGPAGSEELLVTTAAAVEAAGA